MKNHPITIERILSNGDLELSDRGRTDVEPGDTVTWNIHPRSGVAEITNIVRSDGVNVFSEGPARLGGSSNWRGTVNPHIPRNSQEKYDIHYKRDGSDAVEVFDPKIVVNP